MYVDFKVGGWGEGRVCVGFKVGGGHQDVCV